MLWVKHRAAWLNSDELFSEIYATKLKTLNVTKTYKGYKEDEWIIYQYCFATQKRPKKPNMLECGRFRRALLKY